MLSSRFARPNHEVEESSTCRCCTNAWASSEPSAGERPLDTS